MKPQGVHAHEERLLDFAYGELQPTEAQRVEQHVQGCSRCSETLEGIRGVRLTMSRLPLQSAPDTGLDSLMAYAQQAARRSAAGPEPASRWWRRLMAPALGVAALSVFGIVVHQVNREVDLSPSLPKEAAQEKVIRREEKGVPAAPAPAPAAAPASPGVAQMHARFDEELRAAEQRASLNQKKKSPSKSKGLAEEADWSNAGSAGGFPGKKAVALDEDVSGLAGYEAKDSLTFKRGVASTGTGRSAPAMAQRAEPSAEPSLDDASEADALPRKPRDVEYEVPAQRISGSTARPVAVASSEDARQAPEHTQAAMASSPPPPAPAEAPEVPATKAEVEQKVRGKSVAPRPSPAELLRQAEVASRSGDRAQEAALLRGALSAGAQGAQRLQVLSRLCDAESALGRRRSAIEFCEQVVSEAPGSSEAGAAERLLERNIISE